MTSLTPGIELTRDTRDDAAGGGTVACAHCSLPVPAGLIDADATRHFCCQGCRTVYDAIHACGLDRYYTLRESMAPEARPASVTTSAYESFDDGAFHDAFVTRHADGTCSIELCLENIHCGACVWLIERLPRVVDGVVGSRLSLRDNSVSIRWNTSEVRLSTIARGLDRLGYPAHPPQAGARDAARQAEDRRYLIRIAAAGVLAGNVMLIAFALYGGMFHGIESRFAMLFRWTSLALSTIAVAGPGRVFFTGALAGLRAKRLNMDVPIAIGLSAALLWSALATITRAGDVYFDCVTMLIFLLLIGRWIQMRQQRASADAMRLLFTMTPQMARLVEDDHIREVPVETLDVDDIVEVPSGATVSVDGVIESGASQINKALLTGESAPVSVEPGDGVPAGVMNLTAPLRLRTVATGEATRMGRLMRLVEDAAHNRAPIVQLADRLAGVFVLVVLALAMLTAAMWWTSDPTSAIEHAIALLIITCPCALGLATPLAFVASIGRAARAGILIKGGEVLESLSGRGRLFLDKTGTVTCGEMQLLHWEGDDDLKRLVAAIESRSVHPIARAFAAAIDTDDTGAAVVCGFREQPGAGVEASANGQSIVAGSQEFLQRKGIEIPQAFADSAQRFANTGATPVLVARDGVVRGTAALGDALKPDGRAAVERLRSLGWSIELLSGDDPAVARQVARELSLDENAARGGVDPEAKLETIRAALAQRDTVVMVGDGANDAAALSAATVGVAVRGGAEASMTAADVYLAGDGLMALTRLVEGARATRRVIRLNLGISLGYNVLGVGLAMAGLINPILAALLMPISSLTVLTLSYRARTFATEETGS